MDKVNEDDGDVATEETGSVTSTSGGSAPLAPPALIGQVEASEVAKIKAMETVGNDVDVDRMEIL